MTPKLAIPDNITVLARRHDRPMNPVEKYMRDNWLSNRPKTSSRLPSLDLIDQPWDHVPRHARAWAQWPLV